MTLDKFLKYIEHLNNIAWEDFSISDSWNFPYRLELAKLTQLVDYKCDFKKGKCKKYSQWKTPRCCCKDCYERIGFNYILPSDIKLLREISELFTEKVGFWRKGKGCILPRKYRSPVCLKYHCNYTPGLKKWEQLLLLTIHNRNPDKISDSEIMYVKELEEKGYKVVVINNSTII